MNNYVAGKIKQGSHDLVVAAHDKSTQATSNTKKRGWAALSIVAALGNKEDTSHVGNSLEANLNVLSHRWSDVRSVLNDLRNRTESNGVLMRLLNPVKAGIDALRQDYREKVPAWIADLFPGKVTKVQWQAQYKGIAENDLTAIGVADSLALLKDPNSVGKPHPGCRGRAAAVGAEPIPRSTSRRLGIWQFSWPPRKTPRTTC